MPIWIRRLTGLGLAAPAAVDAALHAVDGAELALEGVAVDLPVDPGHGLRLRAEREVQLQQTPLDLSRRRGFLSQSIKLWTARSRLYGQLR